jgi:hypothetical protein
MFTVEVPNGTKVYVSLIQENLIIVVRSYFTPNIVYNDINMFCVKVQLGTKVDFSLIQ